jgi:tetratricopeptide (TPR) repeat protein
VKNLGSPAPAETKYENMEASGLVRNIPGMTYSNEIEQLLTDAVEDLQQEKFARAERGLKKAINLFSSENEAEASGEEFAYLLVLLASVYVGWQKADRAETLYFKAIELLEKSPAPAHRLLCKSYNDLSELYLSVNKTAQAEELLDRANLVCEEWLERHDPESISVMRNLAQASYKLGKLIQARNIADKLLSTQEAVFGSRDINVAETLELLAGINRSQRRFDRSELQFKRALSIQESIHGQQSEPVARLMRKFAALHCDKHDHGLAKPMLKKALAIRKTLRRPQDEEFASACLQLAEVYYVECNFKPSEVYYKKGLGLRKKLIGSHCLEVADALCGIGKLYCAMNRFREAETNFNHALQIQVDLLGPYNKEVASTLTKLAGTYMSQGRFNEANLMKDQAMTCQVQHMQLTVDDFDPYDRAVLYHSQGAYREAEEFYHKALAKVERNLGTDHFHLGEILTRLAELQRSLERYDKAEVLLQQAIKIFQRMQHRAVLTTYAVLADLYVHEKRYSEAEELYLQALAMIEDAMGVRQSDQMALMGGYEKLLSLTGRKQESDKMKARLRSILKRSKNFQSIIQKPVKPESV